MAEMFGTDSKKSMCYTYVKRPRLSLAITEHSANTAQKFTSIRLILETISTTWDRHSYQQLSLFCTDHDEICCPTCAYIQHSTLCKKISVEKASKNVRSGAAIEDLKSRMTDTVGIIRELAKHAKETKATITTKQGEITKEISEIRKTVDQHLKKLEHDINRNLEKKSSPN